MPLPRKPFEPDPPTPVAITKKADAVCDARSYFFPLPDGDTVEVRIRTRAATVSFESRVRGFAEACQELPNVHIETSRPQLLETA